MQTMNRTVSWVVYQMTINPGKPNAHCAVCEQSEWNAMELARPGYHILVKDGIENEAEAEALARDLSGFVAPVGNVRRT